MSESLKAQRERLHTRMLDNEPMDALDAMRELQRAAMEAALRSAREHYLHLVAVRVRGNYRHDSEIWGIAEFDRHVRLIDVQLDEEKP